MDRGLGSKSLSGGLHELLIPNGLAILFLLLLLVFLFLLLFVLLGILILFLHIGLLLSQFKKQLISICKRTRRGAGDRGIDGTVPASQCVEAFDLVLDGDIDLVDKEKVLQAVAGVYDTGLVWVKDKQ